MGPPGALRTHTHTARTFRTSRTSTSVYVPASPPAAETSPRQRLHHVPDKHDTISSQRHQQADEGSAEGVSHLPLLPVVVVQHGSVQLRRQVPTDQLDGGHRLLQGGEGRELELVVQPVDVGQFLHQQPSVNGRFLPGVCGRGQRELTSSSSTLTSS